jgi:hypothetical protein
MNYIYVIDIERFNEKNPGRGLSNTDVESDKKEIIEQEMTAESAWNGRSSIVVWYGLQPGITISKAMPVM